MKKQRKHAIIGGEGGIRTHGTVTRTTVFETVPFDLSGTSPCAHVACHFLGGNLCRFTNPPTKYLARAPSLSDGIFGECQVQGGEEAGCGWQNDQRTCLLDRLGDHDVGHQSEHGAAGYGFGKYGEERERAADELVAEGRCQRACHQNRRPKAEDRRGAKASPTGIPEPCAPSVRSLLASLRNALQAPASDRRPACRARRAGAQIVECPIVAQLLHRAS